MREHEPRDRGDVRSVDAPLGLKRCERSRRAHDRQLGPVPPRARAHGQLHGELQGVVVGRNAAYRNARCPQTFFQGVLLLAPALRERRRILLEGRSSPHQLHAIGGSLDPLHAHVQAESIEELGSQVPLFRVHRPDQQEARCVRQ